ncbi:hypothetical protein ACN27G_24520 [Plantactinospora sp. WMMB334]|uniref:hypothetical protein n=1 Tax=Plantactinospora sp. WMMB334 TaxID=3404119 RepID=UPI003B9341C6
MSVRTRTRQRRTGRRSGVGSAVATLVLLAGTAGCQAASSDGTEPTTPASTGGVGVTGNTGLVWWMSRLDRAGTAATLYVSRPLDAPPCQGSLRPEATVTTGSAALTITVSDGSGTGIGCVRDDKLAIVPVNLPEPLGRRTLIDGYDNGRRPVYREADLPAVPGGDDGSSEVPTGFGVPTPADAAPPGAWSQAYTRPGGPDIRISGYPPDHALARAPGTDPVGTAEVAGAQGAIYRYGGDRFQLRWRASGLVYLLDVVPTEGDSISLSTFRGVLTRLDAA